MGMHLLRTHWALRFRKHILIMTHLHRRELTCGTTPKRAWKASSLLIWVAPGVPWVLGGTGNSHSVILLGVSQMNENPKLWSRRVPYQAPGSQISPHVCSSLSAGLMSTQENRKPEAEDPMYLCLKAQVLTACPRLSKAVERVESSGVASLLWMLLATCSCWTLGRWLTAQRTWALKVIFFSFIWISYIGHTSWLSACPAVQFTQLRSLPRVPDLSLFFFFEIYLYN